MARNDGTGVVGEAGGMAVQNANNHTALRKFVRVIGMRLGRYVEFEFSVNDADLTIELILPIAAFDEFCALHEVTVLPSESATAGDPQHLAWRSRQPGLLKGVSHP